MSKAPKRPKYKPPKKARRKMRTAKRAAEREAAGFYDDERVADLEAEVERLKHLIRVVETDLRIRSRDGVVDISDFIWRRICKEVDGE